MQLMDQIWTGLLNRTRQKLKTPNKLKSAEKSHSFFIFLQRRVSTSVAWCISALNRFRPFLGLEVDRFYGLSDTELDHSKGKPTGNKIQKCDTAFCWRKVTGAEGERLSGRSRNVKGSMLGRFSQQKKKSFFISLTFISGSYTHTHIQLHRHMHPSTRACRLWRWSTDALTHIQHTCEGPQKSGIRCDSQRNTWSNIWHLGLSAVNGCLIHPKKKKKLDVMMVTHVQLSESKTTLTRPLIL